MTDGRNGGAHENGAYRASLELEGAKQDKVNVEFPETKESYSSKRAEWRHAWYDFSQYTTLHGVRNITDDTPFLLRRLIWMIIVCAGVGAFGMQVTLSVLQYLDYPVTVNVKINYNTTLLFPAVSICNQNDFRMTATSESGVYRLVEEYYSLLGSGTYTDLTAYNQTNLTLDSFYYKTAHAITDMVMSCTWDEQDCTLEDFHTQLTDYGVCFTFNSGHDNTPIRVVSQTGADRGLRLRLNIEQYEYMIGPNPGAGIKLLVHENKEVPLVRDLGVAIPPGTHSYIGVAILEVNNLPKPHGECNETVTLAYHDEYSLAACVVECKEMFLVEQCSCRDVYMPTSPQDPTYPPICTLEQYQTCAAPSMEIFYNDTSRCECPIPCRRSMYDSSISYAYSSKFDAAVFLNEENITALTEAHVKAREVSQRVLDFIIEHDQTTVESLVSVMEDMENAMNRTKDALLASQESLTALGATIEKRTNFHLKEGLEKVLRMADYNFIRGYEVHEERTLSLVTFGYQEVAAYIESVLRQATNGSSIDDALRTALYVSARKETSRIEVLCERGLASLSTIGAGFTVPEMLTTYDITPGEYYDLTLVTPELVIYSSDYWDRDPPYIDMFIRRTREFREANGKLATHIEHFFTGALIDMEQFEADRQDFEAAARSYNYYMSQYFQRIVKAPSDYAQNQIDIFNTFYQVNAQAYTALGANIESTLDFLEEVKQAWDEIQSARDAYVAYTENPSHYKTKIAAMFTSASVQSHVTTIEQFFTEVSTRSVDAISKLQAFRSSSVALVTNMIEEVTMHHYYQALYDDIRDPDSQSDSDILNVFSKLVDESEAWVLDHWDELTIYLNADILEMNFTQDLTQELANWEQNLDIALIIGQLHGRFHSLVTAIQNNMQQFIDGHVIGDTFYHENIMHVDVFMRELSYEIIEQQEAYSLISLWSDIGGSMGLFIGASVVTVFELFDMIIHTMCRLHCFQSSVKPL